MAHIKGAQSGDLDSFNRLVLNYQGLAFNVALRIMGDEATAADATQEAFISRASRLEAISWRVISCLAAPDRYQCLLR